MQAAHQSGTACVRHGIDVSYLDSGRLHGGFQRWDDVLRMGPACQFGNNPTVLLVHRLVCDGVGQYLVTSDDRYPRVITGGFNG
jgi:hypothetical protein